MHLLSILLFISILAKIYYHDIHEMLTVSHLHLKLLKKKNHVTLVCIKLSKELPTASRTDLVVAMLGFECPDYILVN